MENVDYLSNIPEKTIEINIKNLTIKANSINTTNPKENYSILLVDENNNPITNKKLNIKIGGKNYNKTTNSKGKVIIPLNLEIGSYETVIRFDGDEEFFKANITKTINVLENVSTKINISTLVCDALIDFKFSKDINETINITINKTSYPVAIKRGSGQLSVNGLNDGKYVLTLNIPKYLLFEEKEFTINKTINLISADLNCSEHSNTTYTVTLKNNGKVLANKTIKFVLNGKTTIKTTNKEGKAQLNIDLNPGTYKLNITYYDDSHNKVQKIYVIAKETNSSNQDNKTNNTECINNQTNNQTNNTKPTNNQTNNTKPTNKQTNNTEPKIIRKGTIIDYQDMVTTAIDSKIDGRIGKYFIVTLKDQNNKVLANKFIQIGFNGVKYNRTTNSEGQARLQINLGYEGLYTFAVAYLGDDNYTGSFIVAKIKVNLQTPKLTSVNKVYKPNSKTKTLTATLKTAQGNAIAGKKISFTIDGKTYTAKTNKNGVATVNVSISKKGIYGFTVKFDETGTYEGTKTSKKLIIK